MSTTTTEEIRDSEFPLPFTDTPVGTLDYDGHEIQVWSIATTVEGNVIFLNCSAADAALSATLRRLLRKSSGKATFHPASGFVWSGPTDLTRLAEHYDIVTQALTHKGLRLKNMCILPDSVNIAAGLARPMEVSPTRSALLVEEEEDTDDPTALETPDLSGPEIKSGFVSYRYMLGDLCSDRSPTGALFAHLKSLVVVCHQEWEAALWEHGKMRGLLVPQPALGIHAWSITRDRTRWTDLVGELWLADLLSRPAPVAMLATKGARKPHRSPSTRY